jgi:very-short-patch-repair endonuclease
MLMAEHDPVQSLLERQNGVIAWWQARTLISKKAVRHRVETGKWRRVHRGVYLRYGDHLTDQQRWWVAVLAVSPGRSTSTTTAACLGGLTALLVHGLRSVTAPRLDLIVPPTRRIVPPAGVMIHRVKLPDADRDLSARPPSTTRARALVDAAQWARTANEARLIIAASFQQRLVTAHDVQLVLDRMTNARRRELILTTVADCAAGSHSIGELDFVALCRRGRLPVPTRQVRRRDRAGRLRYLDACFDPWRVVVEIDGSHHSDVAQMWDDSARQNDLILAGYVVLRYPIAMIRNEPQRVIAEIRAGLQAAGWRP